MSEMARFDQLQCTKVESVIIEPVINRSAWRNPYCRWESISPESTSPVATTYRFQKIVSAKGETNLLNKSLETDNSKGSIESGSEVSPLSQFDDEEENRNPDDSNSSFLFRWDLDSSSNFGFDKSKKGLTWAGWNEPIPPEKMNTSRNFKKTKTQHPTLVTSRRTESCEELLMRRVESTACLWDNAPKSHPENKLESFDNRLISHSAPKTVLKRKCMNTQPLPAITLTKEFVGQHSQGLGGHYKETFLVKKRKFP